MGSAPRYIGRGGGPYRVLGRPRRPRRPNIEVQEANIGPYGLIWRSWRLI